MSIPDASTYPPLPSWWSLIRTALRCAAFGHSYYSIGERTYCWRCNPDPRATPSPEPREGV